MSKAVLIVCDGLADRPIRELNGQTPLEAAQTPNLDKLAVDGISGMMHTINVGVRPGSDVAHLSLLGYDPEQYYTGRGIFECIALGMDVAPGDIAFRANIATQDKNGIVLDRRAGKMDSTLVVEHLGQIELDGVQVFLKAGIDQRIGMVVRGPGLSWQVSDHDPKTVASKDAKETGVLKPRVMAREDSEAAIRTAEFLNKLSDYFAAQLKDALFNQARARQNLPLGNCILFRGASVLPDNMPRFEDKHGLRAAAVAGGSLYRGIAKAIGMDVIDFPAAAGVTGRPDSNLTSKVAKALEILPDYDFIFMHFKGADTLAELGDYQGKLEYLEKVDQAIEPLAERQDILLVVTGDHTTASDIKKHTADPLPITYRGPGVRTDDLSAFSERECAKGRLGHIRGRELVPILIDILGRSNMYGA